MLYRVARVALFGAWGLLSTVGASGATYHWTAGGGNNSWSTGGNWAGGQPPMGGPATILEFGGPDDTLADNDIDDPFEVNQIRMFGIPPLPGEGDPLQQRHGLTGKAIRMSGTDPKIFTDAGTHTGIFAPLVLGAGTEVQPGDNALLEIWESIDEPSGTGAKLTKKGGGGLLLHKGSGHTGGTTVEAGDFLMDIHPNDTITTGTGTGPVEVFGLALLGGRGSVAGPALFQPGSRLSPYELANPEHGETITFDSSLRLHRAKLEFVLGVEAGASDALIEVKGGLFDVFELEAELLVTAGPQFAPGRYRIFNYNESMDFTYSGMSVAFQDLDGDPMNDWTATVDLSTAGRVDIVVVPAPGAAGVLLVLLGARAIRRRSATA